MATFVSVLRAVNLGAHNKIAMSDLRDMLAKLGFKDARTLLLSGNVVFRGSAMSSRQLEQQLEAASTRHLGVATDYFVRSAKEWQDLVKANPFPAEARRDPSHLLMMCLRDAPSAASVKALQAAIKGPEQVRVNGKHAYFVYPDGIGNSKLTITVVEKHLSTRGTARNWNTVLKIAELTL